MGIRIASLLFTILFTFTCNTYAATDLDSLFVTIDGIDYSVELEKSGLAERVQVISENEVADIEVDIELYRGTAPEVPGSWVSASYYEGNWSGLASIYDKLYEIGGANFGIRMTDKGNAISTTSMIATELALTGDFDISKMCPVAHIEGSETDTALATVIPANTAQLNNVALAVGGITQAANIVLTLDHFYLSSYGNGSIARALQILNNVDVIYRSSLGIALNNIAIQTFNAAAQFPINQPDTTNAQDLLDEVFNFQAGVFGNNDRTLGALLTTRDLMVPGIGNGVAGIAPLQATCTLFNGLNLAVSVNEDRGGTGIASVILAHEMGHNFGSNHDPMDANDPNFALCPSGQFIMSPIVAPAATAFSSCSQTAIAAHVADGTCYKQPIDIQISLPNVDPVAATPLTQGTTSTRTYNVSNATDIALTNLNISASIENLTDPNNANAEYTTVMLNGVPCAMANGGQTYTCAIPTINGNNIVAFQLSEIITTTGTGQFKTTVEYQNAAGAQIIDINAQNSFREVTQNIIAPNTPPQAPSNVQATSQSDGSILVTWNDNSNNEQAFIIERTENNGGLFNVIQPNLAANTTRYTDTIVVDGQSYTYRVSASNVINSVPAATTPNATSTTTASISPASSGGGGGGGAFYLMTWFLLLARALTKSR